MKLIIKYEQSIEKEIIIWEQFFFLLFHRVLLCVLCLLDFCMKMWTNVDKICPLHSTPPFQECVASFFYMRNSYKIQREHKPARIEQKNTNYFEKCNSWPQILVIHTTNQSINKMCVCMKCNSWPKCAKKVSKFINFRVYYSSITTKCSICFFFCRTLKTISSQENLLGSFGDQKLKRKKKLGRKSVVVFSQKEKCHLLLL